LINYDYEFNATFGFVNLKINLVEGDRIQIREYVFNINLKGHKAYIVSNINDLNIINPDIVVTSNIDREFEFFSNLKKLSKIKKYNIICHPIHHPYEWIKNIHLAYNNETNINLLNYEKYIFKLNLPLILQQLKIKIFNYNKIELLKRINKFIFLSDLEKKYFEKDFRFEVNSYSIVSNGSDFIPINILQKKNIIIVGRIEPRKNSVNLALILSKLKIKSVFVGDYNNKYKIFNYNFKRILNNTTYINHISQVNREEVNKLIGQSKLLISSSYAEVFPLVELEALATKTAVLSTSCTLSKSFFNTDVIKFCDPKLLSEELIYDFYIKDHINFPNIDSWSEITDKIIEAYDERNY
jgi:glycosyltransferase involved in cell wall biosynthesis